MKLPIPIFIAALLCSSINCLGQFLADVKVAPDPYNISSYEGVSSTRSIKRKIMINDFDIQKPGRRDTISITDYDRDGRQVWGVSFLYGKRYNPVTYSYPRPLTTVWKCQFENHKTTSVCQIVRDRSGKENYYTNSEVLNGDTVSQSITRFFYTKDSLLLKREDIINGKPQQAKTYQYKGKSMVLEGMQTSGEPIVSWIGVTYNKDHLAEQQVRYVLRNGAIDSTFQQAYSWEGQRLATQTRPDGYSGKQFVKSVYTYDAQNRIVGQMATEDTTYQKVSYVYQGKYISKRTVITNTPRSLAMGVYLPYASKLTRSPTEHIITYTYDDKGYLIKTEETLNGILQTRKIYIIEHY